MATILFKAKMYTVHSGNIKAIGWQFDEEKKGVMQVEFRGGTYQYWPVPQELYTEAFTSEGKGSWFIEKIKNNQELKFEKVGVPKLEL